MVTGEQTGPPAPELSVRLGTGSPSSFSIGANVSGQNNTNVSGQNTNVSGQRRYHGNQITLHQFGEQKTNCCRLTLIELIQLLYKCIPTKKPNPVTLLVQMKLLHFGFALPWKCGDTNLLWSMWSSFKSFNIKINTDPGLQSQQMTVIQQPRVDLESC